MYPRQRTAAQCQYQCAKKLNPATTKPSTLSARARDTSQMRLGTLPSTHPQITRDADAALRDIYPLKRSCSNLVGSRFQQQTSVFKTDKAQHAFPRGRRGLQGWLLNTRWALPHRVHRWATGSRAPARGRPAGAHEQIGWRESRVFREDSKAISRSVLADSAAYICIAREVGYLSKLPAPQASSAGLVVVVPPHMPGALEAPLGAYIGRR